MEDLEKEVREVMRNNNWLVLATASKEGAPQSSVVMHASDGETIYVLTGRESLKVRNIQENPRVGVTIPFYKNLIHRLIKKTSPADIHFRGEAEMLPYDHQEAREFYRRVRSCELPEDTDERAVWIRIRPTSRVACYGVGVGLRTMRRPDEARRVVDLARG